jgi:release factor glutamine methyltransferase
LYINFEKLLTTAEIDAYRQLIRRRANHEPIAYITGRKEFYKLDLTVSPATLIPRPETEHLVDEALRILKDTNTAPAKVADIGCGSGAIALALAANISQLTVDAVDLSPEALEVAKANAKKLKLSDKITFWQGNLTQPLENKRFDLICANLPYIPDSEMAALPPDVAQFEPLIALNGGSHGIEHIQNLLSSVANYLTPSGHILLEIWPPSLAKVEQLAKDAGLFPKEPIEDYSKKPRIFVATNAS